MINAVQLARSYDSSITELWRDESSSGVGFLNWLDRFRLDAVVRRPERGPDARSNVGPRVSWYDTPSAVIGFAEDGTFCYRIPVHVMFPTHPGAHRQAVPAGVSRLDLAGGTV